MRVAEQDHQLENHRPSVKLVQLHPPPADMMMVPQQHHKYKTVSVECVCWVWLQSLSLYYIIDAQ